MSNLHNFSGLSGVALSIKCWSAKSWCRVENPGRNPTCASHLYFRRKKKERITSTQPKGPDEMLTNKPTVYENLIEIIL
jgi:hypothetical protein